MKIRPRSALGLKYVEVTRGRSKDTFANGDTLPHNVVITGPGGARLFVGEIFSGVAQRIQEVPALAPGVYQLHCDVHPEMNGDLEATVSAAQGSMSSRGSSPGEAIRGAL